MIRDNFSDNGGIGYSRTSHFLGKVLCFIAGHTEKQSAGRLRIKKQIKKPVRTGFFFHHLFDAEIFVAIKAARNETRLHQIAYTVQSRYCRRMNAQTDVASFNHLTGMTQ